MVIKLKRQARQPERKKDKLIRLLISLIIVCSIGTGLTVNFLNNLYYSKLLLKANSQTGSAQIELSQVRYDVKQLIDNLSIQFNCYDLRSHYARNICYTHNKQIS